jgi:hypothetical protein
MTVSSTTTRVSYSGDNSTTVFAYTFKIFDDDDITVILRTDATGSEAVQTKTTNYSVSGVGETGGGNITFVSPPASGITVVLLRETAQTQTTDYTPNDPFPASSHEDALDKMTLIIQDQQEEINRALKLSRTNTMISTEFEVGATTRANKILAFDDSGELAVTQEIGTFQGSDATTTTSNYNQRDIVKSTTAGQLNNVYICVLDSPSGTLLTNTTYWQLLVDAVSAATSATNAAASAAEAAADAILTAADVESTNADVVLTNADVVSTNADVVTAGNSATAAQNAQTAAELAYDNFDDRYLGAKASDPTLDNDGDALIDGALYFDTTNNVMKVYDLGSTAWLRTTPTSAEQTNINTVSGISGDVTTVAGISSNVTTVAGISSDVTTVAADGTDIGTVAGISANVTTVAGISGNVTTVAGVSANVTTVAGISSDVTTVAGDSADIQAVAADATDIGTVATNIANVNAVGGDIANVNTVATNIVDVNSFANQYRVGASDPTTSLDEGDLAYNTTDNALKFYDGTSWTSIESGLTDIVGDVTPQLGGNLDLNSNNITGTGSIPAANLTGTLPAIDGSALTGISTDLVGDTTPQLGGNLDTNGNDINFGDNDKAVFGAGSDLQIYHDGSDSYIAEGGSGTGSLKIKANNLLAYNNSDLPYFQGVTGGTFRIYYNGLTKLATTATGVSVTGTVAADTLTHSTEGSITTDYVVKGSAKAWTNYNQTGNTVNGSFGISSVTDATGSTFTITYATAFDATGNMCPTSTGANSSTAASSQYTNSAVQSTTVTHHTGYTAGNAQATTAFNYVTVHADLA